MAEYIEREKVIDGLDNIDWYHVNDKGQLLPGGKSDIETYVPFKAVEEMLVSIPAANVRPVVKAHFSLVDGYSITALGYDIKGLECSNCGATFIAQSWVKKFNFCPNCGADMREES